MVGNQTIIRPSDLLFRQLTPFSCGVGVAATAFSLATGNPCKGVISAYDHFNAALRPDPKKGVPGRELITVVKRELPFDQAGADMRLGGKLAIAFIKCKEPNGSFTDHYVLFLGNKGRRLFYYDPELDRVCETRISELDWASIDREGADPDFARRYAIRLDIEGAPIIRALRGESPRLVAPSLLTPFSEAASGQGEDGLVQAVPLPSPSLILAA